MVSADGLHTVFSRQGCNFQPVHLPRNLKEGRFRFDGGRFVAKVYFRINLHKTCHNAEQHGDLEELLWLCVNFARNPPHIQLCFYDR